MFSEIIFKGQKLFHTLDEPHLVCNLSDDIDFSNIKLDKDFIKVYNSFYIIKEIDTNGQLTSKLYNAEILENGYENYQMINVEDISLIRPLSKDSELLNIIKKSLEDNVNENDKY